ncbi:ATP-binding protein [Sporomusa malonica]|uniref:Serine/threonine-protein kinase RsbW n=1 Tax=Sporomusa malonica TaxID=112901 RepID=A0A1W2E776_9FIRM|nr:ATP-binding protein [Sporomusa malonica]SMD05282.1 serine/threonine-protein kinase RsbW [Sporomusa malonica]
MSHESIILKNDLSEIETMVLAIEAFGQVHALPLRIVFDMNLVLEEIITNIMSYGYKDKLEHCIRVDIFWENNLLRLIVTDDGEPFNPLEMAVPNLDIPLEERAVGGLGIYFVKQKMDEVVYKWEQGHNVLIMSKGYAKEMT